LPGFWPHPYSRRLLRLVTWNKDLTMSNDYELNIQYTNEVKLLVTFCAGFEYKFASSLRLS